MQKSVSGQVAPSADILVVDDNIDNLRLLNELLSHHGYNVRPASSGELALSAISKRLPDMILLDVRMPGMDGFEVCRTLKSQPLTHNIPIIFVTASKNQSEIQAGFGLGAVDYIVKPFHEVEVLARVSTHLELYRMRLQLESLVEERTKKLTTSEERFRRLVEGLHGEYFFYSRDTAGPVTYLSPSVYSVLGYQSGEFIQNFDSLVSDHPINELARRYMALSQQGIAQPAFEIELLHRDGEPRWLSVKESPILDEHGKIIAIDGIAHDLTLHRKQEAQLRRTEKMDALGKLTGGIVHDFNNLLGVVLGYTDLLELKLKDQPVLDNYVSQIRKAGERGAKLSKQLLGFSRDKVSGAEELELNRFILESREMLSKALTAGIELELTLSEDPCWLFIEPDDLANAVLNLCINAMHAMEGKGRISIETELYSVDSVEAESLVIETGDYVRLCVCDTGCGMDKSILDKIFDPFYTTKGDKGTGLGLSQVYSFMERNSGSIHVTSTPDEGTCFELFFPRLSTQGQQRSLPSEDQIRGGDETILIVDDDAAMRSVAEEMLRLHGYKTRTAGDAFKAIKILQTEQVDLVLSDMVMPGMSGLDLLQWVQQHHPNVRFQLASGYVGEESAKFPEHLREDLLDKPYELKSLLQALRRLLD